MVAAAPRVDDQRLRKPSTRKNATTLWLWHAGPDVPELDLLWRSYLRRFDIEHTLRFAKNTLGWTAPGVRTPEQADRWSWLIAACLTQPRLARPLVTDQRLPWEKPREQAKLTPMPGPQGISPHPSLPTHDHQAAKTRQARPRTPPRQPNRPGTTPPSHQENPETSQEDHETLDPTTRTGHRSTR